MIPVIASSLIGAGSSLVSDIFSGLASSSASKSQLQATRETNEMNYKIWQEQKEHNIDMWNMQNEYNTPSAQRERMEEAGFSPYATLGQNGTMGMATNAPYSGTPPTMQIPDASTFQLQAQGNPWFSIFEGLSSGVIDFASNYSTIQNTVTGRNVGDSQIALNNSQTGLNLLNKDWAPRLWNSAVGKNNSEIRLNNSKATLEETTLNTQQDILKATLTGIQLSNENQRILNEYLPAEKQVALGLQVQQIANLVAAEHLTYAQAKESATRSILNMSQAKLADAQTTNVNADTDIKKLEYFKASKLAEDYINTALAQNAYERARALAETSVEELKGHKARWEKDTYYDGPLEGLYHSLDKAKSYLSLPGIFISK